MTNQEKRIKSLCRRWKYEVSFHDGLCDLTDTEGLDAWHTWRDVPLDAAVEYLKHPLYKEMLYNLLESHKRSVVGLDLKAFRIIGYYDTPLGTAVVSVKRKPGAYPYCVSYCGSGRYFRTMEDAWNYAEARFAHKRTPKQEQEILRRYGKYSREGADLDLSDFL